MYVTVLFGKPADVLPLVKHFPDIPIPTMILILLDLFTQIVFNSNTFPSVFFFKQINLLKFV